MNYAAPRHITPIIICNEMYHVAEWHKESAWQQFARPEDL